MVDAYRNRFKGSIITDRNEDVAVMVTDKARSALKREHHLVGEMSREPKIRALDDLTSWNMLRQDYSLKR